MRECLICGARKHVQSCEKIQLCTRCAGVLWEVLYPKLHPEKMKRADMESAPTAPAQSASLTALPEGEPCGI